MVNGVHVLNELQNLVGVTHFVVIPADDLYKGVGQVHAGGGVKDRGAGIAQEVGGNDRFVGVA